MELSSWDWVSDRVVEGLIAAQAQPLATHARESSSSLLNPRSEQEKLVQIAFNKLCDRASQLVLADLHAGFDIVDSVDAVFDDADWNARMKELIDIDSTLPRKPWHRDTLEGRFPWAAKLHVSPVTKGIAKRCLAALNESYMAHENLQRAGIKYPSSTPSAEQRSNHLWFLSDPAVPPAIRNALHEHRRASVALTATYPATSGRAPRPQDFRHVIKLLELTTASLHTYLGVLANHPESKITLVRGDGSDMRAPRLDSIAPFRGALKKAGGGVIDPI